MARCSCWESACNPPTLSTHLWLTVYLHPTPHPPHVITIDIFAKVTYFWGSLYMKRSKGADMYVSWDCSSTHIMSTKRFFIFFILQNVIVVSTIYMSNLTASLLIYEINWLTDILCWLIPVSSLDCFLKVSSFYKYWAKIWHGINCESFTTQSSIVTQLRHRIIHMVRLILDCKVAADTHSFKECSILIIACRWQQI